MRICVLGAGTWGTALGRVLANKGHEICIWSKFPEEVQHLAEKRTHPNLPGCQIPDSIRFTAKMETAADYDEYVISAVPSVYTRQTMKDFAPFVRNGTILISVGKGIEKDTLLTMTEIIVEELDATGKENPVVALSGPTHAEEVANDLPTLIVSACENTDAAEKVQKLFEGTCIRAYINHDVKGVQICGALKNVEALAVGIARGLGYGDNTCAALITRGMEEIRRLGVAMGCCEKTFSGLAGIGDLIVTATSTHSRNNRAGYLIGQGKSAEAALKEIGMVVEGMNALPAAVTLCSEYGMDMPIIDGVRRIIYEQARPADVVRELMSRSLKTE